MSSIEPTQQLAALIRVQVASLRQRSGNKPSGSTRDRASAITVDLASIAAQRIGALAPGDPDRERSALRVFLETALLAELGQELVADPAFAVMVDHVQQQMEEDPALAEAGREAARWLLASAAARG